MILSTTPHPSTLSLGLVFMFALGLPLGCAGTPSTFRAAKTTPYAVRMQHQILFRFGDDQHIFDGYMILADSGLIVKAFAGPGIDLFTVVKQGDNLRARLHLSHLKDRMDVRAISEDIARIYAEPCNNQPRTNNTSCMIRGYRASEKYDRQGRLISRYFKDAHGVGLSIAYSDFRKHNSREDAYRIDLAWGQKKVEMVILLKKVEAIDDFDPEVFQISLESL